MADQPQLPSRFITQSEIETTNARKEEAWKAAYARIGQEPPTREVEEKYDGRSLAEKLAANRAAKQEEFENSHKLSAQFRSLDPDEINFLDEVAVKRFEEERKVKEGDEEMLRGFRAAVQARDIAPQIGLGPSSSPTLANSHSDTLPASGVQMKTTSPTSKPTGNKPPALVPAPQQSTTKSRSIKAGLKGVVVQRKRPKASATGAVGESKGEVASAWDAKDKISVPEDGNSEGKEAKEGKEEDEGGDRKRRRVE